MWQGWGGGSVQRWVLGGETQKHVPVLEPGRGGLRASFWLPAAPQYGPCQPAEARGSPLGQGHGRAGCPCSTVPPWLLQMAFAQRALAGHSRCPLLPPFP